MTKAFAWAAVVVSVIPCLGIHTYELPRISSVHGYRVGLAAIALDRAIPWIALRVRPPDPQLHNLIMCVGSACVWMLSFVAPTTAVVVFLYSKVYEYVDTWIVFHRKGKRTSLQRWHHLLTPLFMSTTLAFGGTWPVYYLTCTNSFVHSIMYAYYAHLVPHREFVTHVQRRQFVLGIGALLVRVVLYRRLLELINMLALCLLLRAFAHL